MGRGRGREAILAAVGTMAAALLGAACGSESHPNESQPPVPAQVSVNITERSLSAQPARVGVKGSGPAELTQNRGISDPPADADAPRVVSFTISNTTATATMLEIHGPDGFSKRSGPITARSAGVFKVGLPNGNYTLEAVDLPGAASAQLFVGSRRVSSQNDLLLP
jgi:hypothetical protein